MANSEALRDYWHPVALSARVQEKPVAITLLNEPVALWRTKTGVMAVKDRCIHRGTRLSLGWVDGEQIVCPYHGWAYRGDGTVSCIPALPIDRMIPGKGRVEAYQCTERYGLVFVCMGTPRHPIYEVPEFAQSGFKTHILGPFVWQSGAVRNFENFFDEAHLPWVHPGALGDRNNVPVIPTRDIIERDHSFYFEYQAECQDRLDPSKISLNRLTYEIVPPFTLYHDHVNPQNERVVDLFLVAPISETESARVMVVARNFALDQPPDKFVQFTSTLWEQDRLVIESQLPKKVEMESSEELPIRGPDSPSIVYRRMLRQLGPSQMV